MTSNFRDFARALDWTAGTMLAGPVLRAKQDLARSALTRIIDRTPAMTGHARGNWQVSTGTPSSGVVEGGDPSGAATLAVTVAELGRAK